MKKSNQDLARKTAYILLGIVGPILLPATMSFSDTKELVSYTNSFAAFLMVCFSIFVFWQLEKHSIELRPAGKLLSAVFSGAFSLALVVGKQLEVAENWTITNPKQYLVWLLLGAYFYPFIAFGLDYFSAKIEKKNKNEIGLNPEEAQKILKKSFLVNWLILLFCWIPVFLAFFPGAFVYDAQDEYIQVLTRQFSTHHPLVHVLFMGGLVHVGYKLFHSHNAGIALYTLIQMAILSGVLSYSLLLVRKKAGTLWEKIGLLFFGFFPVIPMYAVCSAKDTLFTAALLLIVMAVTEIFQNDFQYNREEKHENDKKQQNIKSSFEEEKDKGAQLSQNKKSNINYILFFISSIAILVLRNNAFPAYILCVLILLILQICKKIEAKKLLFIACFAIICSQVLNIGLAKLCHADNSENQEILTVPIQQLARTYKYSPEVFSESQIEILHEILPEEALVHYEPRCSDKVKYRFNNKNYAENKRKYQKLWFYGLQKKPVTYLNAWLLTSYGYWYPDAINNVYAGNTVFTYTYKDSSYFGFETEEPGSRQTKFPWLEEQYRKLSLELFQQKVPGVALVFAPGFWFWVYLFAYIVFLYRRSWNQVLAWSLVWAIVATLMLGPTSLVRYVLIFWFGLPILLAGLFEK